MNAGLHRYAFLAWPLACLAICLYGFSRLQTGDGRTLAVGAALCAILAVGLLISGWKHRPQPAALVGLVVLHGIVLAAIWLVIPVSETTATMAAMLVLLVANAVWLARHVAPMPPATVDLDARHAPLDVAILVLPVLMAAILDGGAQARALAGDYPQTLLIYLVYAWFQLFLFLELPVRVLRLSNVPAGPASLACAFVFGLLHLPNPMLMAVTGAVMWVFSWQYQKGRSLLILVVLMALTATTLKIAVPEQISGELRIGPDYVEHMIIP